MPRGQKESAQKPALAPEPIDTENAVYDRLKSALMEGAYLPGEKLSIRKLATQLNASLMPVRTALRRLATERALDVRPSGTAIVPRMSRQDFQELTELRIQIEPFVAASACGRLARADLARLRGFIREQASAATAGDPAVYLRADRDFLMTVYRCAEKSLALAFIESMWMRRGPLFWEARWMLLNQRERARDRHEHMLGLLESGNAAAVHETLVREISDSAEFLLEHAPFDTTVQWAANGARE